MLQPPSPDSFVWYSLICLRRGGSTAAVTLYTVADESKKKMTDCVTRSPARLCSGYRKICYYGHLGTIFSLLFHASLIFSFLIPVCLSFSCSLVCAAAICYSQQVRILQYVFFLLVSFVSYLISKLSCFYLFCVFSWFYFSGGVFCCALVLGTLALDLPTLIISLLLFFSVSLSVTT